MGKITIGKRININGATLVSYAGITIEDDVMFGANVTILDCDGHSIDRTVPDSECTLVAKPVTVKRRAWLGINSIVMKGVTIGEYAVVAANSVVTKNVPPHSIAAGNPAKIVKTLEPKGHL